MVTWSVLASILNQGQLLFKISIYCITFLIQSNLLKWMTALGPDWEYPRRQCIHLPCLYFILCLNGTRQKWCPFKQVIHLSGIQLEMFDCTVELWHFRSWWTQCGRCLISPMEVTTKYRRLSSPGSCRFLCRCWTTRKLKSRSVLVLWCRLLFEVWLSGGNFRVFCTVVSEIDC